MITCRNAACRSVPRVSTSTKVCPTARRTSTHGAARCAWRVTSRSPGAAWRRCTASITRSTLCARTASANSTREHSRNRTTSRIASSVFYDCSVDVFHSRTNVCYIVCQRILCQASLSRLGYDDFVYTGCGMKNSPRCNEYYFRLLCLG